MKLSNQEDFYVRFHLIQNNKKVRILALVIVIITIPFAVFIFAAFVKSSFDRAIMLEGAIALAIPTFLINYLFVISNNKKIDYPLYKKEISGKFRYVRYGAYDTLTYIDDHQVVFLDNWRRKVKINDGDYLKAWCIPMRQRGKKIKYYFIVLSIEGMYQLVKDSPIA